MAKNDILVDGYNSGAAPHPAPDAAKFGVGVTDQNGVRQAAEARLAHSDKLTSMPNPQKDQIPSPLHPTDVKPVGGGFDD